ncbi:hypothetical protein PILCRDRAFT_812309 [Piloderma croceum F 1598]|uniref:Uncharacterized protein n=1 Tax=Piloderma croceum (strain F 1598) TaxID=765440 RepID=A0A0C3GFV7_PILCF|nr:hypothetical protein PILCRDRAFT_812309 [Piloderma croceum F 1598]
MTACSFERFASELPSSTTNRALGEKSQTVTNASRCAFSLSRVILKRKDDETSQAPFPTLYHRSA